MLERLMLRGLVGLGALLLIVISKIQRKNSFKWIFVYFFVAFTSSAVDGIAVSRKWLSYPVRLWKNTFKISILFDGLLFPITCVLYNQWTYKDSWVVSALKVFAFTIPMTVVEHFIERKTRLITYRGWTTFVSFTSLTCYFWLSRLFLVLVTKYQEKAD